MNRPPLLRAKTSQKKAIQQDPSQNPKRGWSLKGLDLLGNKFSLSFSTNSGKFQTNLGGYITLALTLISLGTFILIFSQYFNKESPVVTTSTEFGSDAAEFNLHDEDLYSPIGMSLGPTVYILGHEIPKYVTVVATIEQTRYNHSKLTLERDPTIFIDYIPCPLLKDPKIKKVLHEISPAEEFKWIVVCADLETNDPKDFYVKNDLIQHLSRDIKVQLFPCSLEDRSQCAPAEDIDKLIIGNGKREKFIISSDYENPVRSRIPKQEVNLQRDTYKWYRFEVNQNRVLDDTIQFFRPTLRAQFGSIDLVSSDFEKRDPQQTYCTRQQILSGVCKPYMSLNYVAGGELFIFRRNYKAVTTILGEIGGILKVVTTLVFVLYSFYNIRRIRSYLGLKMLGISKEKFERLKILEQEHFSDLGESEGARVGRTRSEPFNTKKKMKCTLGIALNELLKARSSATNMMSQLNSLEVIEEALFEDDEKRLIPLVLLEEKRKALQEMKEKGNIQFQRNSNQERSLNARRNNRPEFEDFGQKVDEGKNQGQFGAERPTFEEDYKALLDSTPDTQFKMLVKKLMVENLATLPMANDFTVGEIQPELSISAESRDQAAHLQSEMRGYRNLTKRPNQMKLSFVDNLEEAGSSISTPVTSQDMRMSPLGSPNNIQHNLIKKKRKSRFHPENRPSLSVRSEGAAGNHLRIPQVRKFGLTNTQKKRQRI